MNIFILDHNPSLAAQYLCDKHVVKMILESAQLLCTTSWFFNVPAPYKPGFINHRCSKWVRSSLNNYIWLGQHSVSMCQEFQNRYHKIHKSQNVICWCIKEGGKPQDGELTKFVQAMPDKYKCLDDAVEAYRKYYCYEKRRFAKWKNGKIPYWFEEFCENNQLIDI